MSEHEHFGLIVLGSGAVGQITAYDGRERGLRVLVVESRAFGGTCPNRGCDAKKPYVHAAAVLHAVQRLQAVGSGLVGELAMDWAKTAVFEKSFSEVTDPNTRRDLAAAGIEMHAGTAAFTGPDALRLSDGRELRFDTAVVATGQRPREMNIPGGDLAIDSDAFLDLPDLPPRVAFIGAGYIGMEFACAAALAGREVTVVGSRSHPLRGFDPDAVAVLEAALPTLGPHGVRYVADTRAARLEKTADGVAVLAENAEEPAVVADLVVNATGRVASIDGLELATAGAGASPAGVAVDRHLRCPGNPRIWAGGDVADTGRPALIPTAVGDGRVLKHNLAAAAAGDEAGLEQVDDTPPATVAFTTPTLASVGLTEADARERHGDGVHVSAGNLATKKFYRQLGVEHAFYKLIFDAERRLIGAHVAGPESEEVINLFALALHEGCHEGQLCDAVLTYPTASAALQTAYRKRARK